MINLRYHIISITAVFLALGIGLTIGSTVFAQVNLETLKGQVDDVEQRIREEQAANEELQESVDRLESRDDAFAVVLPERLFAGHLDTIPTLVIATRGTNEDLVDATIRSLESAGANVAGTWWLTDRWSLDDDEEVDDLRGVLDLDTANVERLRDTAARRLSDELQPVMPPPETEGPGVPAEPELVASLEAADFLDYEARPGAVEERVLLPASNAHVVAISGTLPAAGNQIVLVKTLTEVAADGVVPVVAVQGEVDLRRGENPAAEDARRTTFVGPLREDDVTASDLSTVDNLDEASGLAALVLAAEDLAAGVVGHYGVGAGADRLIPGPEPES